MLPVSQSLEGTSCSIWAFVRTMSVNAMKKEETYVPPSLFHTADDVWSGLLADLSTAQSDISLEQYIFADDEAGRPFFDLFIQKAREGVSVRLILDAVGSHTLRGSDTLLDMVEAGVKVHFYNEIGINKIFSPRRWLPRNHCKTVIIDGRLVYIGSACVAEEMRGWRELQFRFDETAVVRDVQSDFDSLWESMESGRRLMFGTPPPPFDADGRTLRYVSSRRPWRKANPLYRELLWRIDHAQDAIRLATPYFMPPYRLRRALKRAVKRGVPVTLLMSEKTDVQIADWVARFYYPRLMRAGIRIVLATDTVLHAKYMIVDGDWASIGSTNLDYLSLFRNREANAVLSSHPVITDMIAAFDADALTAQEEKPSRYPLRELFVIVLEWGRTIGGRLFSRGQ